MIRSLLAAAMVLFDAAAVLADEAPARDAGAWCGSHAGEILIRDTSGVWHRIDENLPRTDDEGRFLQVWQGDLDGDGRRDLIVKAVGGCGTRECPIEAFVSCPDGTYSTVLSPEYGDKVKVMRTRKRGWAMLELRTVGEAVLPSSRYLWTTYCFAGSGYAYGHCR